MPPINPLAIDGAAPSTTTNVIALSDSLNSRIARGNHAIDGIVCSPVNNAPTATRNGRIDATNAPTAPPTSTANPNPTAARRAVTPTPSQKSPVVTIDPSSANTVAGAGSTNSGRHSDSTAS